MSRSIQQAWTKLWGFCAAFVQLLLGLALSIRVSEACANRSASRRPKRAQGEGERAGFPRIAVLRSKGKVSSVGQHHKVAISQRFEKKRDSFDHDLSARGCQFVMLSIFLILLTVATCATCMLLR